MVWLRRILSSKLAKLRERFLQAQARDVLHEQRLEEELNRSSEAAGHLVARGSSPSQHAFRREQAVILANALEQLPADYRDVIVLHQMQGKTLGEVAGKLGRSLDSVTKLWVRALAALEQTLEGQSDEPK